MIFRLMTILSPEPFPLRRVSTGTFAHHHFTEKGGGSWTRKTSTTSHFFETMSKRRKGFPSETRVKRGVRVVHGDKELEERLGRNDLCPCGSGRRFKKCCRNSGCFRRGESGPLLLENEQWACSISMVGAGFFCSDPPKGRCLVQGRMKVREDRHGKPQETSAGKRRWRLFR